MTGQSTQRPTQRPGDRAAQPPTQRAVRPQGGQPTPQRGGPTRTGSARLRLARPQAGWVLLGLPLFGALVDEVSGAPLGTVFAVCSVLASAWAALLVTRRGLWWVLPSPPLVIAGIAFLDQLLLHSSDFAGTKLGTGLLKWSVELFPAMFFALLAALAAPALRRVLTHRAAVRATARAAADRDAQVPVPRRSHHG
ncbi:DUF6542 domain-containing protein [Streptacidiphilus jiangxiensis]|uniref:DUF6542 domain-containing protein n=1 Tax=Streptacidiphilus jiangxiensis TaxID=235985 RepID=A0A1H7PSB4_STRJI|nr:DUF6542 domain-containing protein [Streptacidiphilus jiangxiensis]SEL38653.1 hypothetical protein SAMN05414137_108102 [Streptacidiphilus jiangxiensis]